MVGWGKVLSQTQTINNICLLPPIDLSQQDPSPERQFWFISLRKHLEQNAEKYQNNAEKGNSLYRNDLRSDPEGKSNQRCSYKEHNEVATGNGRLKRKFLLPFVGNLKETIMQSKHIRFQKIAPVMIEVSVGLVAKRLAQF